MFDFREGLGPNFGASNNGGTEWDLTIPSRIASRIIIMILRVYCSLQTLLWSLLDLPAVLVLLPAKDSMYRNILVP